MWINLSLIITGLMTIIVPSLYYDSPNGQIIMSTVLFFVAIYLTTLYFVILYYKETKETLAKDNLKLKEEMAELIDQKKVLENKLAETIKT
jgi:hypothetical protein